MCAPGALQTEVVPLTLSISCTPSNAHLASALTAAQPLQPLACAVAVEASRAPAALAVLRNGATAEVRQIHYREDDEREPIACNAFVFGGVPAGSLVDGLSVRFVASAVGHWSNIKV